ncbi:protein of unknown function [Acidithiobacillus ferrivorans]|uniref:Uncharacterized protein n=1 Tax=Acidithiobacillus ferrivorans TaxID=160808 RepID=A0A060UQE8_9PROT|nr:hypothetical protein AFERRI_400456 [Acidithiobacillus ferrivorans]SMH64701.1 protein of unknown function [Acidithiobacillus ferrivorans]
MPSACWLNTGGKQDGHHNFDLAGVTASKISFPCLSDMGMRNFYATWGHQESPYMDTRADQALKTEEQIHEHHCSTH